MPRYGQIQDARFAAMDEPAHVLEQGGTNGKAGIKGLPVRPEVAATGLRREGQAAGVMAEPVAVLLRDAVTIDTAVRLTGAERQTLQVAAARGYLPSLKLGGATAPYLVRIRDVMAYLNRMNEFKMARGSFKPGRDFLGFPDWLIDRVHRAYPEAVGTGTPLASAVVVPNRGGRPRTKPLESETPEGEKTPPRRVDHAPRRGKGKGKGRPSLRLAPAKTATKARVLTPEERTRLPKWHPLWIRPGSQ